MNKFNFEILTYQRQQQNVVLRNAQRHVGIDEEGERHEQRDVQVAQLALGHVRNL